MNKVHMDYSKLIGRMAEKGFTRGELSKAIGITQQSLTRKLKNLSPFYADEIVRICDLLEIDVRNVYCYFFAHEV